MGGLLSRLFRSSEFTVPQQGGYDHTVHLSLSDIALDSRTSPKTIQVHIKQSKTDPFRQGVNIYLGRTDQEICPVSALVPYLAIRGGKAGPLFILPDGRMLTRFIFSSALDSLFTEMHMVKGHYNTHSFRIGAATSAMDAGIADAHVKMLGRWRSDAYQRYVRTPPMELAKLSKQLASGRKSSNG